MTSMRLQLAAVLAALTIPALGAAQAPSLDAAKSAAGAQADAATGAAGALASELGYSLSSIEPTSLESF